MTYPEEILNKVMDAAAAHKNGKGADLVGINMEGPFISPKKVGAQNPEYVQGADAAMFRRLQKRANGLIKLVDVAPEEPGNLDFIKECHNEVRISIAHTCTDYDTAVKAFAPGPIIAAMEHDAEVELITDNVHIHPAMVRFTFNTFGDDRICLIADSAMSCGLPDGQYSLGGQAITVKGPRATLTEHPDTIAGSNTCLYDCMKRAVLEMNVPLESAVRAASETPAKSIGVDNDYGSLAAGRYGNVILADKELNLKAVIQKGVRIV
jgi:N-acetylglucosamine-6-phosphate deacetylase